MIVVVVVGSIVIAGGPFTKRQNRLNDWLHGSCGFTDVFSYQARPCASLRGGGHELAGRLCDCDDATAWLAGGGGGWRSDPTHFLLPDTLFCQR